MAEQSLLENSVEELLHLADEFDDMAATACTEAARQELQRLASRFRVFAAGRAIAGRSDIAPAIPGGRTPCSGTYELRNVFGTRTGDVVQVRQAALLPRAPLGFTWHLTRAGDQISSDSPPLMERGGLDDPRQPPAHERPPARRSGRQA
jgi:hypothetical protein